MFFYSLFHPFYIGYSPQRTYRSYFLLPFYTNSYSLLKDETYYYTLANYYRHLNDFLRVNYPDMDKFTLAITNCSDNGCRGDLLYEGRNVTAFNFSPPATQEVQFDLQRSRIEGSFKANFAKVAGRNCVTVCIYQKNFNTQQWSPIALGGKNCKQQCI